MSMRTFSAIALSLAIVGCGSSDAVKTAEGEVVTPPAALPDATSLAEAEASAAKAAADDGRIACAVSGATEFARVCQLEQSETAGGLVLTVRHPDGGFRRLQVVKDGRGVVAADGAETAEVTPLNPRAIEVRIAGNRYQLPATVKSPAAPQAAAAPAAAPAQPAAR
jgi:hypothetical protein